MTENQIKAIAEEYVKWVSNNPKDWEYLPRVTDAKAVLTFLNKKYCIVEREKVMESYNQSKRNIEVYSDSDVIRHANCGAISAITQLFGKEMFNQNEE